MSYECASSKKIYCLKAVNINTLCKYESENANEIEKYNNRKPKNTKVRSKYSYWKVIVRNSKNGNL